MDDPVELRRRAKGCRQFADMPGNEEFKAAWLVLAEDWERRAQIVRTSAKKDLAA
jgi:hypothetical protein